MKIKFIGQKGIPATFGGVEYHVENLACELAARGHEVHVYVRAWYTPKNKKEHKGVRLIHVPTIKGKHLDASIHSFLCSLHALFSRGCVVHYHGIGPAFFAIIPRLFGKKTAATIHRLDWATEKWGSLARKCLQLGERVSARLPHKTIVVSRGLKQYVKEKHGRDTVHISHGIELPKVLPAKSIKKKYGLIGGDYILFMGRLSPEKRVDWVIDAFKNITPPAMIRSLKLVIAGGSSATDAYVARIQQNGSNDERIIFTGYVTGTEKAELLSNALIFVMPSSLEGYPIALLEGKTFGRCCLVSDIPPHKEALVDGNDGRLFDQHSLEAFTTALQDLLDHPKTISEIGRTARKMMEDQPGWAEVARETEQVYLTLKSQ